MAYAFRTVIQDERLNKSKTIVAATYGEFQSKINIQRRAWDEQWEKQYQKQLKIENDAQGVENAQNATEMAEHIQEKIENMLRNSLNEKPFDFEDLKDFSKFSEMYPKDPAYKAPLREPQRTDEMYNPKAGLLTKMFGMAKYNAENQALFENNHEAWARENARIASENAAAKEKYDEEVKGWQDRKVKYEMEQQGHNAKIDEFKEAFYAYEVNAIEEYIGLMLNATDLPIEFNTLYDVEYIAENRQVIVDAMFPVIEDVPKLKSVSYVKSKQEMKESYYSEAQIKKKYDDAVYQLVLIHLNKIFSINKRLDLVDGVVLNGIVDTIDKATGNNITPCILSIRISRENFEGLNLEALEPKAWFRSARGIAAANIATVTPVQPVQTINKEDKRFVEGYDVIDGIDSGVNLAAIDWQDFENLVRQVFEQEFSSNGGEVKITQASRDGGVDAVAFDPDPIRGGKIVIQAKRYTNVVGVSAVRDLYGTLMNEGAMKGILVTTSYFGNDAYEFANGKPIQLIDGAGLLGLLERHGHKARIDLKEAKQILKEE